MTAATIIRDAEGSGVRLTLTAAGTIKILGEEAAVARWLPIIREHKPELVSMLEAFEERAAILEFDGGLAREQAEAEARRIIEGAARKARSAA